MTPKFLAHLVVTLVFAAAAEAATDGPGAIAACREAHESDPNDHIACLERALLARDTAPAAGTSSMAAPPQSAPTRPAPAPESATEAAGLGAEQVAARRRDAGVPAPTAAVRIVSASYGAHGLGTFRMEDGQVWRETERTPDRYRIASDRQYTGRIVKGTLVGYRMYLDGVRWMYKVERVQ